jgi:hypothetical protein
MAEGFKGGPPQLVNTLACINLRWTGQGFAITPQGTEYRDWNDTAYIHVR